MASIDKLISKINKAKSAINSFKGIASKFSSKNFTSALDKLGEQAEEAKRSLEKRRTTLEQSVANNKCKLHGKFPPPEGYEELRYPLEEDLDNYITFQTRLRRKREGQNAANVFGDTGVEIMLYIPDGLSSTANVNYTSKDVGLFARGIQDIREEEGIGATFNEMGDQIVALAKKSAAAFGNKLTANVGNINDGKASNPMQEQMLEGIGFRSFSFDYEFWPKSVDEANEINKIIYSFRTAMLPDTFGSEENGDAENYFNFPNVFDVEFEGPVRDVLDGFLPMVCTKCDVDHFNGQKFATFTGGQPVSTKMSLEFVEIKILSQENYQQISPLGDKSITGMPSLRDDATNTNNLRNSGMDLTQISTATGRNRKGNPNREDGGGG